jgi:lysophospholipase L1-like esterase
MKRIPFLWTILTIIVCCFALRTVGEASEPIELLRESRRIVMLGDSITFGGQYIVDFEAWLLTQPLAAMPTVVNVGLPSETVSGLSEEGHAGGAFPRPDLAERLARVLEATKPDLVFACYGINCGIYLPLSDERFERYQAGIRHVKQQVEAAGAKFVAVTPPCFDDQRAKKEFSYNAVLGRYADWLLAQREQGWQVVDLYGPMTAELAARRQTDPDFTFQPDAVHPNAEGHWFMASRLIRWFGDDAAANAASVEQMLAQRGISPDAVKLLQQRMAVLRDAYVAAAGHKRPGIRAGLPVSEARQKAAELTEQIRLLTINE